MDFVAKQFAGIINSIMAKGKRQAPTPAPKKAKIDHTAKVTPVIAIEAVIIQAPSVEVEMEIANKEELAARVLGLSPAERDLEMTTWLNDWSKKSLSISNNEMVR